MANLAMGIDTGGTFTDGVVFDIEKKTILAKTKTITTRHNLKGAIDNCINNLISLDKFYLEDIKMVSLSTTLATNAIVEGQGAEVGLILIGFQPDKELPTPYHINIAGGCNIKGKIKEEVDLKAAKKGIEEMKTKVDAFAVSGYLSIRNPEQEKKVAKLAREMTGYPVVCAYQLTSDLGFHERAVTAVFNARLMPLITDLIKAVQDNLENRGMTASLMVVRGDGSLISAEKACEKPIETSLSGPAASIVGAMTLTGIEQGVVVDMGGTTTDVAVLNQGKPRLTKQGARVGGWLTRVKAAEITTIGLGGDSFIQVSSDGILEIGPQRVFPLCWAVNEFSHLYDELKAIKKQSYSPIDSQPTSILHYIKDPVNFNLTETEKEILKIIKNEPHSLYHIARKLDKSIEILPWRHLVNVGSVHRSSLTPTDILHLQGKFTRWNREAAILGTEIMAARYQKEVDSFAEDVIETINYKLSVLILGVLSDKKIQESNRDDFLLKQILSREDNSVMNFSVQVKVPIIAVGAPAAAYFPDVARKLNANLHLPPSAEVANAVGTVSGKVVERLLVIIKPGENGGFLVHTPDGRKSFIQYEEAVAHGKKKGRELVYQQAVSSGAREIEIFWEQHNKYSNFAGQNSEKVEDKLFIESRIEFSAVGKPWD